jgi:DNA repair protein SbcD/Mre11
MRIVHIADTHLGFRRFLRLTPAGLNQREADVARAFRDVIDRTITLRPDVVLFAGDIFHSVRPSNPSIHFAFRQLSRLTAALPGAIVVMVAGNHDTPRAADTGSILPLFREIKGVSVVDREPEMLRFEHRGGVSIYAVPETGAREPLQFTPNVATNILLLHGEVEGVAAYSAENAYTLAEINPALWDYVALGHYHVHTQVAPNAFYAGAIEYTSSDPWSESRSGIAKSFIVYDTETRTATREAIKTREHFDLDPIDAADLNPAQVDKALRDRVATAPGNFNGAVVRQVVTNLSTSMQKLLDYKALRNYKARALNYQLEPKRPERERIIAFDETGDRPHRPSLDDMLRDRLARNRSADEAADLQSLGARYLDEAGEHEESLVQPDDGK